MVRHHQPYLHDVVSCVRAPALAISGYDGQIRPGGANGIYYSDRRIVDQLVLKVDDAEPSPIASGVSSAAEAWFSAVVRELGDPIADPTVTVERHRTAIAQGVRETIRIRNRSRRPIAPTVTLQCTGDFAAMAEVKSGTVGVPTRARPVTRRAYSGLSWSDALSAVSVEFDPTPEVEDDGALLRWQVELAAGDEWILTVTVSCVEAQPLVFQPASQPTPAWSSLRVRAGDHRVARLVERGLEDLESLLLADPLHPHESFLAAGSPWFLTLFGRDALWAARFLLPTGTGLAASTLRILAARQGRFVNPSRDEEPGKILHEVRREDLAADLPLAPSYYGTVDATPLWICLLADAWRWGMSDDEVAYLMPHLESALAWMRDFGDSDGDGFLEYVPQSDRGLSNQGWKDSHDSVQWFDGRLAESPIALCEVQGYAYEAAVKGADLLDAFDRPGADEWRDWAHRLQLRFRKLFWAEAADGIDTAYPAIALDRDKQPVDTVSSNIGHLLGTGILDPEECELVAARLARSDMDCGWGLRTMTSRSPRFNPLSYHGGSVWPHDTTIAILGLAATGHVGVATSLARGLVRAAEGFDFRLPELFSGDQARAGASPVPYPAACRPQAWAAATGVAILGALLGLRPDVPAGFVDLNPIPGAPFGSLDVDGLVIANNRVHVRVSERVADGEASATVDGLPESLRLDVRLAARPSGQVATVQG